MASSDLVGRPLVPFFDGEENVNHSLQFAEGDNEREEIDVDARVWDKELGYFVYPSEQSRAISDPIAIKAVDREGRTESGVGSKLLLTPSMVLSSSAPNSLDAGRTFLSSTIGILVSFFMMFRLFGGPMLKVQDFCWGG